LSQYTALQKMHPHYNFLTGLSFSEMYIYKITVR